MSEPAWVPLGAQPPGGRELAYVERTTVFSVTATTEATAQEFLASGSVACDGQPILLEHFIASVNIISSLVISLWIDGVDQGIVGVITAVAGTPQEITIGHGRRKLSPSPGNHIFSLRAHRASGTTSVNAGLGNAPGAYLPAFLRITQQDVPPNVVPLGAPPLVTALPGSPVDGQEVILTDSLSAGTYHWHLRYVSGRASNKWVFVGGSPMSTFYNGPTADLGTAYANVGTATGVIPVSGLYTVSLGCMFEASGAYPSDMGFLTFSGGGIADGGLGPPAEFYVGAYVGSGVNQDKPASQREAQVALTSGTALQPRGRRRSTAGIRLYYIYIGAIPIAVGG